MRAATALAQDYGSQAQGLGRREQDTSTTALKLFISYSRADLAFGDELYAGLEVTGFAPMLDRHGINEGEDWKLRLGAMIAEAETVVFVVSPDSAKSEICAWEVEEAPRLSKRIVPVLWRDPKPHRVPERLAALNYVRFDPNEDGRPRSFMAGVRALDRTLRADLAWLRDMARWLLRAQEWDRGGRPANRLLSGSDIAEMKDWVARRPASAPELTALHLDYLQASEAEDGARATAAQRAAEERERLAREREEAARKAETAVQETARTQRRAGRLLWGVAALVLVMFAGALWQARQTEQREVLIYTSLAATAMNEDRHDRAMRFALQAYPPQGALPWSPFSTELEGRLAGAPTLTRHRQTLRGHSNTVFRAAFSPDGRRIVTASFDNTARIWDAESGKEIALLKAHEGGALRASWRRDGRRLVTAGQDGVARIEDVEMMTVYRVALRERVCAEKLVGAQAFTDQELADPILRGIDPDDAVARNPCLRRGPLSPDYWTRLPDQIWRWLLSWRPAQAKPVAP